MTDVIIRAPRSTVTEPNRSATLVARRAEVDRALHGLQFGAGVLVVGEAGIGKTALARCGDRPALRPSPGAPGRDCGRTEHPLRSVVESAPARPDRHPSRPRGPAAHCAAAADRPIGPGAAGARGRRCPAARSAVRRGSAHAGDDRHGADARHRAQRALSRRMRSPRCGRSAWSSASTWRRSTGSATRELLETMIGRPGGLRDCRDAVVAERRQPALPDRAHPVRVGTRRSRRSGPGSGGGSAERACRLGSASSCKVGWPRPRPPAPTAIDVLAMGEPLPYETLAAVAGEDAILELDRLGLVSADKAGDVLRLRFAHPLLHAVAERRLSAPLRRVLAESTPTGAGPARGRHPPRRLGGSRRGRRRPRPDAAGSRRGL